MPARNGFTLIEVLVATAVLTLFLTAVLLIVQTTNQALGEGKVRAMAIQLAQDQLELAHNMAYDHIGTVGGIPAGDLQQNQTVTRLGVQFTVTTSVLYIDDTYDEVAPADLLPDDYKRVRVSVSWTGAFASKTPVVLMVDVAPPGVESINGAGTLLITVFNALGQPVSNALVHVSAPSLTPQINLDAYSDVNGQVTIPGAPVCTACYRITTSKEGYTSDRTYGTDEVDNPAKPHVTVLQSRVSTVSFAIDQVSTLTLRGAHSRAWNYAPFAGVSMSVHGTKVIGRTATDDPVYKVNQTVITSGMLGTATIQNLDWDTYMVSLPNGSSVNIAGTWPFNPISVNPGQSTDITVVVDSASANSLLVRLAENVNQPLNQGTVQLTKDGYIATGSTGPANTGDWSQVLFNNITPGAYTLTASANGYLTATDSMTVAGNNMDIIIMSQP